MVQHLSVRVPWHDSGWSGAICKHPEQNHACRVLKNIAEKKNDSIESDYSNKNAAPIDDYQPPCLLESGSFMSDTVRTVLPVKHPYKKNDGFKHIKDTEFSLEPYSFLGRPYWWTLRENARLCMEEDIYCTQYDDEIEPETYSGAWVSNGENQFRIFSYFYKNVIPDASIIAAYVKTIPFIESPGRIIVGFGHVTSMEELRQYEYYHEPIDGEYSAYLWERSIRHSIRENRENGFIFPFEQIQDYLREHPEQDPDELVVFSHDEYHSEFSYATEHLSHDALIYALNKAVGVLQKYNEINLPVGNGATWENCIQWCKLKLKEIWKDRGGYPGLGSVLCATGVPYGYDVAEIIKKHTPDVDLWDNIPTILENLKQYIDEGQEYIAKSFTKTKCKTWIKGYYKDQIKIMQMLSRMNISREKATFILDFENIDPLKNSEYLLNLDIDELAKAALENPYILYEKTRMLPTRYLFSIEMIDLAMFPDDFVRETCLPRAPYDVEDPDDERRLRAILTALLEKEACFGNTIALSEKLVRMANTFRSDVPLVLDLNVKTKTLKVHEDFFIDEFAPVQVQDGGLGKIYTAYQLNRLAQHDKAIRNFFNARLGRSIELGDDWETLLNTALDGQIQSDKKHERQAREEKIKAIVSMATSKISVLTGGAETGKTTTLVGLCLNRTIQSEGIVVLAPTGKARVVLSQKLREKNIHHDAFTLFQYLLKSSHCDVDTMSYYLSGKSDIKKYGTVIIDESSMLTEEMLAALVEAATFAKRVIFVGDPNQLPPIGAGKPFFEIVSHLRTTHPTNFAQLAISNRQKSNGSTERLDVELSRLFTADQQQYVIEDIFNAILHDNENIEFIKFEGETDFHQVLFDTICKATHMSSITDIIGFDKSLGGDLNGEWMNFKFPKGVENWQVLSPYRNDEQYGSIAINRNIQNKYRVNVSSTLSVKKMTTPYPLGHDAILYGDKVINVCNKTQWGYPTENCINYVANGEVGIVERIWKKPKDKKNTHQIRFSSQPDFSYNWPSVISESDSDLELAYALTVHKAQGSGFKSTIFIINEPEKGTNALLSRELIYTALTRHSDKIYIMYNKEPWDFKKYSMSSYSDLARRLTNLFCTPRVCEEKNLWYDEHLIHLTSSGEKVRSKSEVIIANELKHANILYSYEKILKLTDGSQWLPDFTIANKQNGEIYWEHLGMLHDVNYRKRWESKKATYAKNGISEERGNLIITSDSNGGIDTSESGKIAQTIASLKEKI